MTLLLLLLLSGTPKSYAQDSVRTVAGLAGSPGHADGDPQIARFADPVGLTVSPQGITYIADSANHCLRVRASDGRISTLAGQPGVAGTGNGTGLQARFDTPSGIGRDPDGSYVVSDTGNHTIRRVWTDGRVSTIAGAPGEAGITNGAAGAARFNSPLGVAVAVDHTIFVADSGNHSVRQIQPDGTVSTVAGENAQWGAVNGAGGVARFNGPVGLAMAPDGSLVVADSLNHALRRVTREGLVTTLAGRLGEDGSVDGPASDARFGTPAELSYDASGRLYIADAFLHTLRRLDPDGTVSTVAGLAGHPGDLSGDNGTGRFFNPYGVAVAPDGSLFVTDTYNSTLRQVLAPFALRAERPVPGGATRLQWESVIGRQYQVWYRDGLEKPWQALGGPATANALTTGREDGPATGTRLYQVERLE